MKRAAVALLILTVACGGSSASGDGGSEAAPSRVIGLITDVEPQNEMEIPTNFTVEEEDGDAYDIDIDPDFDYGFDLLHVREHFATEDPVDVSVREEGGSLVATGIEDVE